MRFYWILMTVVGILVGASLQAQYQINQLEELLGEATVSEKLELYENLSELYLGENANKSISYSKDGIELIEGIWERARKSYGGIDIREAYGIEPHELNTLEVDFMINLGKAYRLKGNQAKAIYYFESAQVQASDAGYKIGKKNASLNLKALKSGAEIPQDKKEKFLWAKKFAAGLDSLKVGEKLKETGHEISLASLTSRAEVAKSSGKLEQAINLYLKMVPHYDQKHDSLEIAGVYNEVASLYNTMGMVSLAKKYNGISAEFRGEKVVIEKEPEPALIAKGNLASRPPTPNPTVPRDTYPTISARSPLSRTTAILNSEKGEADKNKYVQSSKYQEDFAALIANLKSSQAQLKLDSLANAILIRENATEIEMLRTEKELSAQKILLQKQTLSAQKQLRNTLLIVLGLILLLAGLLYNLFSSKKKAHRRLSGAYGDLEVAHAQLKSAQTQLVEAEKMASLGQLTAGIAHEINNPVNFISGNITPLQQDYKEILSVLDKYEEVIKEKDLNGEFAEVEDLKEELDLPYLKEEINSLLVGMEEGAARTTEIVKGLRDFSRLDELEIKQFDVHHGIDSTLTLLMNQCKDRIDIHKAYDDIPQIEGFPGKLNQVFMNVLSNAIQAIPNTGDITITTQMLSKGAFADRPVVRISFLDTGYGMNEEAKAKAFEPFFTTKDVGEGTGLGLAISLGIVEQHDGTIEIDSEEGKGTEIILSLPIRQER